MSEEINQEQTAPSKEKILEFFNDQIDVKKVQYELQELNTKLAVARAEELKALAFIAQMTQEKTETPYEGGQPHTITQEDMDANPELAEQGIKVGDEVLIPAEEPKLSNKKRGLKTK
jgi:pantothenate kinase